MNPDTGILQIALSLALIVAAPGPTTAAVTMVSASLGPRQAAWAIAGILCGDIGYLLLASSGASATAHSDVGWSLLKLFSGVYLGQMALRMLWTQVPAILGKAVKEDGVLSPALTKPGVSGIRRALAGFQFHGMNPGAAIFFFTLVPALVPRNAGAAATIAGCAVVMATHLVVACLVLAAYAALGRMITSLPGADRWIAVLRIAMAVSVFAMAADILADIDQVQVGINAVEAA